MSLDDYYKYYGLSNVPKKIKDKQEINNLLILFGCHGYSN